MDTLTDRPDEETSTLQELDMYELLPTENPWREFYEHQLLSLGVPEPTPKDHAYIFLQKATANFFREYVRQISKPDKQKCVSIVQNDLNGSKLQPNVAWRKHGRRRSNLDVSFRSCSGKIERWFITPGARLDCQSVDSYHKRHRSTFVCFVEADEATCISKSILHKRICTNSNYFSRRWCCNSTWSS